MLPVARICMRVVLSSSLTSMLPETEMPLLPLPEAMIWNVPPLTVRSPGTLMPLTSLFAASMFSLPPRMNIFPLFSFSGLGVTSSSSVITSTCSPSPACPVSVSVPPLIRKYWPTCMASDAALVTVMLPTSFFSCIYSLEAMACLAFPATVSEPLPSTSRCPLQYKAAFWVPPAASVRKFCVPGLRMRSTRLPHWMSMAAPRSLVRLRPFR